MRHAVLAVVLVFAGCAGAEPPPTPTEVNGAAPVAESVSDAERLAAENFFKVTQGNFRVERFFAGPGEMIGLVAVATQTDDGTRNIAWATPDGTHIMLGAMVDGQGVNHTPAIADKMGIQLGPRTPIRNADGSVSVRSADAAELSALTLDKSGKGSREVWVVIDPLCPHCRDSVNAMNQDLMKRHLKVNWIYATTIGGAQADQLIESRILGQRKLSEVVNSERADVEPRPLDPKAEAYLAKTVLVLDEVVRQRAVPAVIYKDGDAWRAKTGFNPMDYLPAEVVAEEKAKAEAARALAESANGQSVQ